MKLITLEDIDTAARTVYGEARGELVAGMIAVAWVIRNRAEKGGWWGDTLAGVCKHPFQFSCWNPDDSNCKIIEELPVSFKAYGDAVWAVMQAIMPTDRRADPTHRATHYHAGAVEPKWAKGQAPCVVIGNHLFYNDIQ